MNFSQRDSYPYGHDLSSLPMRLGLAWHGAARQGKARRGKESMTMGHCDVWCSVTVFCAGLAWHSMARHGRAWRGTARLGKESMTTALVRNYKPEMGELETAYFLPAPS